MTRDPAVLFVGLISIAAFAVAFRFSRLAPRARAIVSAARETAAVVLEATLDDEEKERLVRRAAVRMFAQFLMITLTGIAVLVVPGIVISVADISGIAQGREVLDLLLSWEVLIGASALFLIGFWFVRPR